jgi:hypothetical protein
MLSSEVKIRLIHEHRSTLLNRMFDELCRNPSGDDGGSRTHNVFQSSEPDCGALVGEFGCALSRNQLQDFLLFLLCLLAATLRQDILCSERNADILSLAGRSS